MDAQFAILFLNRLDQNTIQKILNSFSNSNPPFLSIPHNSSFSVSNLQWLCHCLSLKFGFSHNMNCNLLIFHTAKLCKDYDFKDFLRLLTENKITNLETQNNGINILIDTSQVNRPLVEYFLPQIRYLFSGYSYKSAFSKFGYRSLILMNDFSKIDVSEVLFQNNEEMFDLFTHSYAYTRSEFSCSVQNAFWKKFPFPTQSFYFNGSKLMSLLNTSSLGTHFIDITYKTAYNFMKEDNIESVKKLLFMFPELQPWFIVSGIYFNNNSYLKELYSHFLEKTQNVVPKSLADSIIERRINDFTLLTQIRQLTGTYYNDSQIVDYSIPYLFKSLIFNLSQEDFSSLFSQPLFSITDTNRKQDSMFFNTFTILFNTILGIQSKITNEEENDEIESYLALAENSIRMINDPSLLKNILIDMFSLIFLQSNQHYLCNIIFAEKIINLVIQYWPGQNDITFFKKGLKRMQVCNIMLQRKNIESSFCSDRSLFEETLIRGDYDLAGELAHVNPIFFPFYSVIKQVTKNRPKNPSSIAEIALLSPDTNIWLSSDSLQDLTESIAIPKNGTKNKEIHIPIKKILQNRLNQFSSITFNPLDIQAINMINSISFNNLSQNLWNHDLILQLNSDNKLFSSFLKFLDICIQSLMNSKSRSTLRDVFAIPPEKALITLLQENDIINAKKIASSLNQDIAEFIISFCFSDFSLISSMVEIHPVVFNTIFLEQGKELIGNDNNSILRNYQQNQRKKLTMNNSDNFNKVDQNDFLYQEGCSENIIEECFKSLFTLDTEEIIQNTNLIIDFSYRLNPSIVDSIIDSKVFSQSLDIKVLALFISDINCSIEMVESILFLSTIDKPLPLNHSFAILLSANQIDQAIRFYQLFSSKTPLDQIILSELTKRYQNNQDADQILSAFPKFNENSINSIPNKNVSLIYNDFYSMIPHSWITEDVYSQSPSQILFNHIDDDKTIQKIMSSFPDIIIDNEVWTTFNFLSSQTSTSLVDRLLNIMKIVKQSHNFLRHPIKIFNKLLAIIEQFINKLFVENSSSEDLAIIFMTHTVSSLNYLQSILPISEVDLAQEDFDGYCNKLLCLTKKINLLQKFCSLHFTTKFDRHYSLSQFDTKNKGNQYASICYEFDFNNLAKEIINTWELDSNLTDRQAIKYFSLSAYEEGFELSVEHHSPNDFTSSEDIIHILSHFQFFDPFFNEEWKTFLPQFPDFNLNNDKAKNKIPKTSKINEFNPRPSITPDFAVISEILSLFYKRLRKLASNDPGPYLNNKSFKYLNKYIKFKIPIEDRIRHYTSTGKLEEALNDFKKITTNEWNVFLYSIIEPSIQYNFFEQLRFFFGKSSIFTKKSMIDQLLDYSINTKMMNIEFQLESLLGKTDVATITAINLFQKAESFTEAKFYLQKAADLARSELSARQKLSKNAPELIERKKILRIAELIPIQLRFCDFCETHFPQLNQTEKICIFSDVYVDSIVVLAMKGLEFDLALEIITHCNVDVVKIGVMLADNLVNEGKLQIIAFLNGLVKNLPKSLEQTIIFTMIMRISEEIGTPDESLNMIRSLNDKTLKIKLLIQFYQIEEAYHEAKENKITSLYPLIGHMASLIGEMQIAEDINKLLDREK